MSLLSRTVYGSKGPQFRHLNRKERIKDLVSPDFHTLWKGNQLLGVAVYCNRTVSIASQKLDAYYIRYFAVEPNYKGQGIGKKLTKYAEQYYVVQVNSPTVFYAYIEGKNLPSLSVSNAFHQIDIGSFSTFLFSRVRPKKHSGFESSNPEVLKDKLRDYSLYTDQKIGYNNGVFCIKKNGKAAAIVQAQLAEWEVVKLPGILGWLTRNVIHFIPYVGRLAPRSKMRFVAFEGLWWSDMECLEQLIESCLYHFNCNIGMLYFDREDKNYEVIQKMNLGLLHKLQGETKAQFLANFLHCSDDVINASAKETKLISAFDLT